MGQHTFPHRYAREYALECLRLLVLGLVALEDAPDVRAEHALVRVECLQFLAQPGVKGVRRDRHGHCLRFSPF